MLNFRVMPDGGEPYEVTATTRDILKWERTTKGASFHGLQRDMHIADLYRCAYYAAQRLGLFAGSAVAFEDTCDIDILDDQEEEPDPTQPAPSAGP